MEKTILPTDTRVFDEILAAIKKGSTFCLIGHQNPDADVIGAELAMASLIRRIDPAKKVTIGNSGKPPSYLSFLPGFDAVKNTGRIEGQYDVLIVFECSGAERMGDIFDLKSQAKTVINIDHHLHNPMFGHINYVESDTSSISEILYKIFLKSGLPLQKEEAICLYTGVVSDTGWFRYSNTNAQTHDIAARLLEKGVPVAELSERITMSRTEAFQRLLGSVLSSMQFYLNNRVVLLTVPLSLMKQLGAEADDLDEVINVGLMNESVAVSILLKELEEKDVVKVSFRSKERWDINKVARKFNGGGHKNASGCKISGTLDDVRKTVLKEFESFF